MLARVLRGAAALAAAVVIIASGSVSGPSASAAPQVETGRVSMGLAGFAAGNIISDEVFFADDTMSAGDIQAFLNERVPVCQAGYRCLKDFAQSTSTRAADLMCRSTYQGSARQTAAEIIYHVARACGINPQVILATLQKEQGLVTHTWPSEWRYTIAMGQGCPDTAACDTRYYGFFNQVYGAAWQFKRYANPPGTSNFFTWYAPGKTWNILYNPDRACGSSPVFVANQATANLYYYTPYQPNAAALAAGYGTGNGCSAYGNRNFYNYFTDWFGSTQTRLGAAISTAYAALGGSSGFLGAPLGPTTCGLTGGGCYRNFAGGAIYWTAATGAWALSGKVRDVWSSLDYERGFGYPLRAQICGLPDGGCYQDFQSGVIYSSAYGTFGLNGWIRQKWSSLDYERGLGFPTSSVKWLASDASYQDFQRGVIYSTRGGTRALVGKMREVWSALDYERGLGFPSSDEKCLPDGACFQDFLSGVIYSSAAGTFGLSGAIRQKWSSLDYERGLGYPVTPARPLAGGARYQDFQRGVIYSSSSGTFGLTGSIRATWAALDYERGLGFPSTDQRCLADGACYQDFTGGVVYSSSHGTYGLTGAIRQKWAELDYERGLGYPTGPQRCDAVTKVCSQTFVKGTITWNPSTGAQVG
ncbi:LGFP repeat-containing protein [Microbacterium ureisolvens]|uniref:LGFP repeat-containing protein n=1 Tax=Microbacterium ureisolvens TaxID=2781186 RepID=UPI0036435302